MTNERAGFDKQKSKKKQLTNKAAAQKKKGLYDGV